jgi:hypothetical protein
MLLRTFVSLGLLFFASGQASGQHPVEVERDFVVFNHAIAVHPGQAGAPEELLQKGRAILNLTDVQMNAVKVLLDMRDQTIRQIHQEAEAAQMKLHEVSNQPNANATEVGTAFLAVLTVHQRIRAASQKFHSDFQALLSTDQRAMLERLNAASQQIGTLQMLGVLNTPDFEIAMPGHGPFAAHVGAVRIHKQD